MTRWQPAGGYDELCDLLDEVRAQRGLSFERIDELCGFTRGMAQKILGPSRDRLLSRLAIDTILPVLGIRLAAEDDPVAISAIQPRWEQRVQRNVRANSLRVSRRVLDRARPLIIQEVIAQLAAAATPQLGRG